MIEGYGERKALAEFCRRDPERYAFHLGDLSEREWPHCSVFAWKEDSHLAEVVLLYRGLSTPSLQLLGSRGPLGHRLDELLPRLPREFYVHGFAEDFERLAESGRLEDHGEFLRMRWTGFPRWPLPATEGEIVRMSPADGSELEDFFAASAPESYFESSQLERAPLYGLRVDGRLLACAGFHVYSPEQSLGVLGNVATLPEARGKGLARAASARLLFEQASILDLMMLNAHEENGPARSLYARLGFREALRFREGRVLLDAS